MKTLSWIQMIFWCCFFVTPAFSAPCWQNEIKKSIMPQEICFDEIILEKDQGGYRRIYLSNKHLDESVPLSSIKKISNGKYKITFKTDYINYSENCGLNLFSKLYFQGYFTEQGEYADHQLSELNIKYTYTANNCRRGTQSGEERYTPFAKTGREDL